MGKGVLLLLLALMASAACADAFAGSLPRLHESVAPPPLRIGAINMDDSGLVARSVTGVSLPLHLTAADRSLGTAYFIGGIGTSAADGVAVGGLEWQAGGPDGLGAGFGVLRTGLPGVVGGGLLTQANLRLPLPFFGNDPSLGLALGSYAGDAGMGGGDAGRVSLAVDALGGRYSVSYAQAQSGFRPLGSQLTADQASLGLSGHYAFGRYQLTQSFGFQPIRPDRADEPRAWHSDTFWGGPVDEWFPLFTTFQLHARLRHFQPTVDHHMNNTGWLLEAQGTGMYWQSWQFDSSVALGRTVACTPTQHAAWRFGGVRPIRFGGFTGNVATHFGVKLHTTAQTRWRVSSSLALKMHHSAQQLSLGVHWLTNDWDENSSDGPSWRVMLRYSIAASETLPRLVAAIGRLVPGM